VAIDYVSLACGSHVIAEDCHEGWSGAIKREQFYRVSCDAVHKALPLVLRVCLRSDGGTDSHGSVWMAKLK
jgi:hypothetical protein